MNECVLGEPDFFGEPEVIPVMDRATAAHLYASPHVHAPDGACIRNRLRTRCDAPRGASRDSKEGSQ